MEELPHYESRKTPITADAMNTIVEAVKRVLGQSGPYAYNDSTGSHHRRRPTKSNGAWCQIIADAPRGGLYECHVGTGPVTGPTNAGALSLSNQAGVTFGTNKAFIANTAENELSIHLLKTNGSVVVWADRVGAESNSGSVSFAANIPLPPTLSCTNVATGTNAPLYAMFRDGTGSNQAVANSQTPHRLFAFSGTNFTITPGTVCGYRLSGTGVVMTFCNETNAAVVCTP